MPSPHDVGRMSYDVLHFVLHRLPRNDAEKRLISERCRTVGQFSVPLRGRYCPTSAKTSPFSPERRGKSCRTKLSYTCPTPSYMTSFMAERAPP